MAAKGGMVDPQYRWGSDLNLGADDPMYFQRRQEAAMQKEKDAYTAYSDQQAAIAAAMRGGGSGAVPASIQALDTVSAPGYSRGGPGGDAAISQGAYDQQQQLQLAHDLRMQEFDYKKNAIAGMTAGGDSARVTRTPENQAAEQASRDAAFARAKEKAGQTARASMAALDDAAAESGMMGSSVHAAKTGAIIGGAANNIGEFLRDQAITEADRAAEVSDMDFMAQVSQRGQEMQRKQALMSLLGNLY